MGATLGIEKSLLLTVTLQRSNYVVWIAKKTPHFVTSQEDVWSTDHRKVSSKLTKHKSSNHHFLSSNPKVINLSLVFAFFSQLFCQFMLNIARSVWNKPSLSQLKLTRQNVHDNFYKACAYSCAGTKFFY